MLIVREDYKLDIHVFLVFYGECLQKLGKESQEQRLVSSGVVALHLSLVNVFVFLFNALG